MTSAIPTLLALVTLLQLFVASSNVFAADVAAEVFGAAILGQLEALARSAKMEEAEYKQFPLQIHRVRQGLAAKRDERQTFERDNDGCSGPEVEAKRAELERECQALEEKEQKLLEPNVKFHLAAAIGTFCASFAAGDFVRYNHLRAGVHYQARRLGIWNGVGGDAESRSLVEAFHRAVDAIHERVLALKNVVERVTYF